MVDDNAPALEASASSQGLMHHGIISAPFSIQDCTCNPNIFVFNLNSIWIQSQKIASSIQDCAFNVYVLVFNLNSTWVQSHKIGIQYRIVHSICTLGCSIWTQSKLTPRKLKIQPRIVRSICIFCVQSEFNPRSRSQHWEFNQGWRVQSTHFCVQSEFKPSSLRDNLELHPRWCI